MIKRKYEKREKIKAAKFEFTYERLQYLVDYQGNGKAPDKRFDSGCEGLSLFIYPNGAKTFYACKRVEMYNKKKNRTEKNAVYKKIFRMEDHPNKNLKAAKLELPKVLAQMVKPKAAKDEKTFGSLAKDFRDKGFSGYRLADKSEKHEYKQSSINKYTKLINSYILLKGTDKIKEMMSKPIWFEDRNSNKPLKDYKLNEITKWHIDCVHYRMDDTRTTANDVIKVISIIYSWAKKIKRMNLVNPVSDVVKYRENKVKVKLSDLDRDTILHHCESKAFDYNPRFLSFVALSLLLGKRAEELYGLRWNQPPTEKEKKNCSGWLLPNWEREKYLFLHDTKNRKPERVFLDQRSIVLLQRLQRSRHTEANKWAVKSPFLFPQRKKPELAATSSSFRKQLIDLNNKLDLEIKFQIKISRKTFGSMIADKYGIERAARKLNHSSTKVTKEHYIVPEDRDLEIEDVYQSNVERLKKAE